MNFIKIRKLIVFLFLTIYCQVDDIICLHHVNIYNYCSFPVWVGILPNQGSVSLGSGGFLLSAGASNESLRAQFVWSGSIWGRTGCDSTGHCKTGDCGGQLECTSGPTGPTTVAQLSFNGLYGRSEYEVSLIDGFNVPMQVEPYTTQGGSYYHCNKAGCKGDLNKFCPVDLAVRDGSTVIACKSHCQAHNTDEYCCRNFYDQPDRCKVSEWPINYVSVLKNSCNDARMYKYDSSTNTFWCGQNEDVDIKVTFCPQ